MGGLADLLFFGLLLWFVFRAAGRAAEGMRGGSAEGTGEDRSGGDRSGGERWGTPRRPPEAATRSGREGFRERLMEELRHWEAEQRVRGEPGELPRSRTEAPAPDFEGRSLEVGTPAPDFEGRSLEVGTPEPDFEGRSLEIEPEEPITAGRMPRETRRLGRVRERTHPPARARASEERPVGRVPRATGSGAAAALDRGRGVRLPDLSGYTPVERAVLWGEILGPPRGLRDD